jgi:hypothetical protein
LCAGIDISIIFPFLQGYLFIDAEENLPAGYLRSQKGWKTMSAGAVGKTAISCGLSTERCRSTF